MTSARVDLEPLGPSTSVSTAAHRVLEKRWRALEESVKQLRRDAETHKIEPGDLHQARVALRRMAASLSVFEEALDPEARPMKILKRLKKLRREIGTARTCDVMMGLLDHERQAAAEPEAEMLRDVIREVRRVRRRSLDRVRETLQNAGLSKLESRLHSALELSDAPPTIDLGTLARSKVIELLASIDQCELEQDPVDPESLHELRLIVKRLRYSAEATAPAFDADHLDSALAAAVEVQDRLGAINDTHETAELLGSRLDETPADEAEAEPLARLHERFARRRDLAQAEFLSWWRRGGRDSVRRAFESLLGAAAFDPPPSSGAEGLSPTVRAGAHARRGAPMQ